MNIYTLCEKIELQPCVKESVLTDIGGQRDKQDVTCLELVS